MELGASCEVCGTSDAKRCVRCFEVAYCSKECQRKDWDAGHKVMCKIAQETRRAQRLKEWKSVPRFAREYQSKYPKEKGHFKKLLRYEKDFREDSERSSQNVVSKILPTDPASLTLKQMLRWKHALQGGPTWDDTDPIYVGKILDIKPAPYLSQPGTDELVNKQQIFRNTSQYQSVYEFGKTYVSFGYVDLWNLMDGTYMGFETESLKFYGYDQGEVTVARSLVILEMMKAPFEEISSKTILQVWLSSCFDLQTKTEFITILEKLLSAETSSPVLKKYTTLWYKTKSQWGRESETFVRSAQEAFMERITEAHLIPLLSLKREVDRVKYCRYLLTGVLFANEEELVCCNPTMFPSPDDNWERKYETFFASINTSKIEHECDSLINEIFYHVRYKLMGFRTLVQGKKILCHLEAVKVSPTDNKFAKKVKALNPYTIDWSNLPDYMERLDFLDFAKKCSTKDTLHTFHLMNWVCNVYGANHIDLAGCPEALEKMLAMYQEGFDSVVVEKTKESDKLAVKIPPLLTPTAVLDKTLSSQFSEAYAKHFLEDLNCIVQGRSEADTFDLCLHVIHAHFTFNREMKLGGLFGDYQ